MRWRIAASFLLGLALCATAPAASFAQAPGQAQPQDNLRDALRRNIAELRAAQDAKAAAEAALSEAQKQRDLLQQQLDTLRAQQSQQAGVDSQLAELRAELAAQKKQNGEISTAFQQVQAGYAQAAEFARGRDALARQSGTEAKAAREAADLCRAKSTELVGLGREILRLYEDSDFRTLMLGRFEPVFGLKRVAFENLVQDYEDKLLALKPAGAAR